MERITGAKAKKEVQKTNEGPLIECKTCKQKFHLKPGQTYPLPADTDIGGNMCPTCGNMPEKVC